MSLEEKMQDIEYTILLLWLFSKRRKSRRLMENKKLDLFLGRENLKENFIHLFKT